MNGRMYRLGLVIPVCFGLGLCIFGYVGEAVLVYANVGGPYEHIAGSRMWALAWDVVLQPKAWIQVVAAISVVDYIVLPAALIGIVAGESIWLKGSGRRWIGACWGGFVLFGVLSIGFGILGIMAWLNVGGAMFWVGWTDGDALMDQDAGFLGKMLVCGVASLVLARRGSRWRYS